VATSKTASSSRNGVLIDFALQGGGAHGAFTWGALARGIVTADGRHLGDLRRDHERRRAC
jgi:hypothetical protein